VCFYSDVISDFVDLIGPACGDAYCQICPSDTCLINCPIDQTVEESVCTACPTIPEACIACTHSDNCSFCTDSLCELCEDFETCTECVENAGNNSETGLCECATGFFNNTEVSIPRCDLCSEGCASCQDETEFTCTICQEDYYLQPNASVCLLECPSGYTANDATNVCDGTVGIVLCHTFDTTVFVTESTNPDVTLISGTSFGGDAFEPIPVYRRGLWYDGGKFVSIDGLSLNHSFTLSLWTRPSLGGSLFSISKND